MRNEWHFFADVQQRLASGQHLVTGYFAERLQMPPDEQRGLVLDEAGHEYLLGEDYRQALTECIRGKEISWTIRFQERLICFGPGVASLEQKPAILVGPDDEIIIDPQ